MQSDKMKSLLHMIDTKQWYLLYDRPRNIYRIIGNDIHGTYPLAFDHIILHVLGIGPITTKSKNFFLCILDMVHFRRRYKICDSIQIVFTTTLDNYHGRSIFAHTSLKYINNVWHTCGTYIMPDNMSVIDCHVSRNLGKHLNTIYASVSHKP
jgi:hypothetical protein